MLQCQCHLFRMFFDFLPRFRELFRTCVKSQRLKMSIDFTSFQRAFLGFVKTTKIPDLNIIHQTESMSIFA